VGVEVDESRRHHATVRLEDGGAGRRAQVLADLDDESVLDDDVDPARPVDIADRPTLDEEVHAALPSFGSASNM
jgi:hypothetical protein